MVFYSNKSIR